MGIISWVTGWPGVSGFGSASTAEEVTEGIDASRITAIVTGASSGIGAETVRVLALRGARVVIAARNLKAAEQTKHQVLEGIPTARIETLKLDLSSFKSIQEFATDFDSMELPLNLLINNAGVMFCPHQLSEDGIEMQFATNHLGHFLLTNLLLEKMRTTAKETGIEGRIVNLSSIAHRGTYPGGIRFDKINDKNGYFDKLAYGQSKLANILHANELSRRLKEEGINVTANSVHPGIILTNLWRHSAILTGLFRLFTFPIWKNIPQGAATTCYAALHPGLKGVTGKYLTDCNEGVASSYGKDEELAKQLWKFSEKLLKSAQFK